MRFRLYIGFGVRAAGGTTLSLNAVACTFTGDQHWPQRPIYSRTHSILPRYYNRGLNHARGPTSRPPKQARSVHEPRLCRACRAPTSEHTNAEISDHAFLVTLSTSALAISGSMTVDRAPYSTIPYTHRRFRPSWRCSAYWVARRRPGPISIKAWPNPGPTGNRERGPKNSRVRVRTDIATCRLCGPCPEVRRTGFEQGPLFWGTYPFRRT